MRSLSAAISTVLLGAGLSLCAPHTDASASRGSALLRRHALLAARQDGGSVPPGMGMDDGYFYSFWKQGSGDATYMNGDGGAYSITWNQMDDFVAGKGWQQGAGRNITYTADFETDGNSYLAAYGWSRKPLAECYVLESFGSWSPASNAHWKGKLRANGGTYDVYKHVMHDAASIDGGLQTFPQYWSIRRHQRTRGTINMQKHFDAWQRLGLTIGDLEYQIFAVEGYHSSGNASVVISESE